MRVFGFPTFASLSKLRRIVALFRKESTVYKLLSDITGDVTDGLRKEVTTSIDHKVGRLVKDIRTSVHGK